MTSEFLKKLKDSKKIQKYKTYLKNTYVKVNLKIGAQKN